MARLILKRGEDARLRAGHPWIYRSQIADLKGFSRAGEAVEVMKAIKRALYPDNRMNPGKILRL